MRNFSDLIKQPLSISLILYLFLAVVLIPFYKYQINPDGISYISIAQKYIALDIKNAVTGYWGPLISWLLIPFILLGLDPMLSFKILCTLIGVVVLVQSNSLIERFIEGRALKYVLLLVLAIVTIDYALFLLTPDILFLSIGLGLVNLLTQEKYNYRSAIYCGILGAFLYFTKGYGLPFFVIIFLAVNLLFYFRTNDKTIKKNLLKSYGLGMLVFFFISFIWVALLSNKYGGVTYATNTKFVNALMAPNSLGHPQEYKGLLAPPNETAISVWEDISFQEVPSWNKFGSIKSIKYQLAGMVKTIYFCYKLLYKFSYLEFVILIISILYLMEKGKKVVYEEFLVFLMFIFLLISGYVFVLYIEDRYIWLCNILLMVMGAKMMEALLRKISISKRTHLALIFIFGLSFLSAPRKALLYGINIDKDTYVLSEKLKEYNINGNIASSSDWNRSMYLCYYNNWRYFGVSASQKNDVEKDLLEQKINYLIVWNTDRDVYKYFDKYEDITQHKLDNELNIYKLIK